MPENEVTDWDPPRLLGYTWAKEGRRPDHLRWELRPAGLAELIGWVAPYQRLWQGSLDALERHLDGGAKTDPETED